MGGRETALVHLHEEWRKLGHDVISFVPVERSRDGYVDGNICRRYLTNFDTDVVVSWEDPTVMRDEEVRKRTKLAVIEMQVAHLQVIDEETGQDYDPLWDAYAVLSKWAGDFLRFNEEAISPEKVHVFPNGVDLSRYPAPRYGHPGPGPYEFIYSSSPDRGLNHLLDAWPRLREMYPGSTLHICYGVETWLAHSVWSHSMQAEAALSVMEGLELPGVQYHGRTGQRELAKLQVGSALTLYPCDSMQPTETGCITAVESGAACTPMVLGAVDCLPSEFGDVAEFVDMPFNEDEFLHRVSYLLEAPERYEELQRRGRELAESRSWDKIALQWIKFFEERIN